MMTKRRQFVACIILLTILATTACSAPPRVPNLGGLYNELAQNGWGLADPKQDKVLQMLLPEEQRPQKRAQVAFEYLTTVLNRAKLFTAALDVPARPPESFHYYLVTGDAEDTDKAARFSQNGQLTVTQKGPGDSVVLRSSALMDERGPERQTSRLISPIGWKQVLFLFSDHRNITNDPAFTDNLLYILLESPRDS
jgi:hypothetical protein